MRMDAMVIIEHTVETIASTKAIWKIWEDVESWKSWDHEIEWSQKDGPFKINTTGRLKPKGGPVANFILTEVIPFKKFVDVTKFPLIRLVFSHFLKAYKGKTTITHRIEMFGLLSFFFAFVIGRSMKKSLPIAMQNLIKKAETICD
jgi:hypothetical protein